MREQLLRCRSDRSTATGPTDMVKRRDLAPVNPSVTEGSRPGSGFLVNTRNDSQASSVRLFRNKSTNWPTSNAEFSASRLHVEVLYVLGVALNEALPRWHGVAHEHVE